MQQQDYTYECLWCSLNPCECSLDFAFPTESWWDIYQAVLDTPSTPPEAPPTPPGTPPKGLSEHEPSMRAMPSGGSGQSFDLPLDVSSSTEKTLPPLLPKPQGPIPTVEPRQESQTSWIFSEATVRSKKKCKTCSRSFTGKSARQNLWRHEHWKVCTEGGNPVYCSVCGTQFGRNDALNRHNKSKTHINRVAELASKHALGSGA
jgi:uncharacterized Zn-finger protein